MGYNQTKTNLSEYDIGIGTYGSPQVLFPHQTNGTLKIGNYCSIAEGVKIFLGGEHNYKNISTFPFDTFLGGIENTHVKLGESVIIGNDVWIGHGVMIMSGVTIADGCVIGAGSVIRKSILEPYSIVYGNPQQFIKKRFDDDIIDKLMEIKWWEYPEQYVHDHRGLLLSGDFETFDKNFGK